MQGALSGLTQRLDEALRVLELRRYRRILHAGRLPIVYAIAIFAVTGMLIPFLFSEGGILAGPNPISREPAWGGGMLLTVTALGAALGGYLRAQHLWQEQRQMRTLHTWLLTRQVPGRAAFTTVVMGSLLGMTLVAVPVTFGVVLALFGGINAGQLLLYALYLPLCAFFGSALGAVVFFVGQNLIPRPLYYPGIAGLFGVAAALWLRLESVQHGWARGWEEHTGRIAQALTLATPGPWLAGIAAPKWWNRWIGAGLELPVPWWLAILGYGALLGAAGLYLTLLAVSGYRRLAADPDLIEEKPRVVTEEGGREFYWKGFANPVLTRDIRTRLRSKDTAEFIFFASIAVAAGAFIPLILTARDLSDPLLTARAARQIFFWLTMTLIALVTLISPALTADVITQERTQGTLEMLIGTSLRPRDILLGKLLGAVSVMLLLISPSLPLFGLCYLFHGASSNQVVGVYALVVVSMTIAAFLGLAQSSINPRGGMAKFWAYALTAFFVGFPGGPFWIGAALAAPNTDMKQQLSGNFTLTAMLAIFWIFGLVLLWGNSNEQLEYSEY